MRTRTNAEAREAAEKAREVARDFVAMWKEATREALSLARFAVSDLRACDRQNALAELRRANRRIAHLAAAIEQQAERFHGLLSEAEEAEASFPEALRLPGEISDEAEIMRRLSRGEELWETRGARGNAAFADGSVVTLATLRLLCDEHLVIRTPGSGYRRWVPMEDWKKGRVR